MNVFIYVGFLVLVVIIFTMALTYFGIPLPFTKKADDVTISEDNSPEPEEEQLLPPIKTKEEHETLIIGIIDDFQ